MKRRQFGHNRVNIWPGFVDALATLIMAIIFVLMIFIVAQVYLSQSLTTKDQTLSKLTEQLQQLDQLLATERNHALALLDDLTKSKAENEKKQQFLDNTIIKLADTEAQITKTATALLQLQGHYADLEKKYLTQKTQNLALQQKLATTKVNLEDRERALVSSQNQETKNQIMLQKLQFKLAKLTENLAKLQQKRDSLTEELQAMTDQNQALNKRLKTIVAELQESLAVKDTLNGDLKQLKLRFADLTTTQQTLLAEHKILKTENKSLSLKKDQLQATQASFQQQKQQLTKALKKALSTDQKINHQALLILELQNAIAGLQTDINKLNGLLDASQADAKAKQVEILNLGKRLNAALAAKVESLSRYQSRFMTELRNILGNRPDIRIIDDRFIFQSEVLFASGSTNIAPAGQQQLSKFAKTLLFISKQIPESTDWVLRVDGHTDKRAISTVEFPDNWALSTSRARAVVHYLIDQGIPPQHLAATGFGQYRPLDTSDDETAYRRNRRIEFRLTSQ